MKKTLCTLVALCMLGGLFAFPAPANALPDSITLSFSSYNINVGGNTTITATVTDGGVVASGAQINWSFSGAGGGTLSQTSTSTDGNGQTTVTFTATTAGAVDIRAELAGTPGVSASQQISVSAPPVTYNITLGANPASIGIGATSTLNAMLTDNSGVAVAGAQINWSIVPGGTGSGSLLASNSHTSPSGLATMTFTAAQTGTVTIQAVLNGSPAVLAQTAVTITAAQGSILTLSASPTRISNGGYTTLTAPLTNNGVAVPNTQINWSIVSGTGGGSLTHAVSVTNASGQAVASFLASRVGTVTIRATLSGNNAVYAQTAVTIDPSYTITVNASPVSIKNGASTTFTATLRENGMAVVGQRVNWTMLSGTGGGSLGASYSTTNSNGQASVTFKASKIGTVTVRGTLSGSAIYAQAAVAINPTYTLTLQASPATIANGGKSTLTATLRDGGVAAANQRVNWSFVSGTGAGRLNASYSTTNSLGQTSVTFQATKLGSVTVRATLYSNTATYAQAAIQVASPVTKITLNKTSIALAINGAETLTATVSPSSAYNRTLVWSSNNPNVAAVNASGRVTGVRAGTAVITAVAADGSGVYANCTVSVTHSVLPPTGIGFPAVAAANVKNAAVRPNANTKGKVLGRLKKGAQVQVIGLQNGYFVIPWPNATGRAYVSASQLNVAFAAPIAATASRNLSIYTRASTSKKYRLATIPKGVTLTVTGRYGSWYTIDFSGRSAYVQAKYISVKNQ